MQAALRSLALALTGAAVLGCASAGSGARPEVKVAYSPAVEVAEPAEPPAQTAAEPQPSEEIEILELPADGELPEARAAATGADQPSPEEAIALSLEAYESSQVFWQQGAFDDAFAALDGAYELMSGVEVNGDPLLAQQKEDLRRLISRRIVEIYASQRTVVAGEGQTSIPLQFNRHVEREIKSFQSGERQAFLDAYERSGLYRPMILEALREAGMPEELSWLPMVESWFKVRAFSRARALGMWQFIASTGYRFGLKRDSWYDERMDPQKSTRAAIAYLSELHELFGDWTTALAAYNSGEARVLRLIRQQRVSYFDQFWDLYDRLPQETRRYVPRFLATLAIVGEPAKYGFDDLPRPLPPVAFETVEVGRSAKLEDLERSMGLAKGSLAALNPELRRGATPDVAYELKVPRGQAPSLVAAIDSVPRYRPPAVETSIHRVRRGETLSLIARRYRTSVGTLMRLNGLSNPDRLRPGQRLRVTGRATYAATGSASGPTTYTVRRGDSLWLIARRFGTTVDRIRRDNNLRRTTLQPGQRLKISGGSAPGRTYTVRRGDTLSGIAAASRVSVRALVAANGLSTRSTIYPGQRLRIPE